ncbi:MAG: fasciclin domain-containing protein [Aliifodinibius sp.]|nr:fasciclin domain-containing protein [Fodinibius sp.]NIV10732.1 fasciclin domain-containing protein [Fodinibius sp.]NIY24354.1 fasciclin domain-containing protein [Fodinibius sp.]
MKLTKILTAMLASVVLLAFAQNPEKNKKLDHHNKIISIAQDTDQLSTLVTAVKAADLVETLNSEGPFTVFAPTNGAFNNLPDGTLNMLLKEKNKGQLQSILTYHVVSGKIMSSDLKDGQMVETVQGNKIKVSLSDGAMVNGANVVKADVEASNGVVHIIDAVIMPSDNEEKEDMDSGY